MSFTFTTGYFFPDKSRGLKKEFSEGWNDIDKRKKENTRVEVE